MSSPYLLGCSVIEESPLADKYYLQLAEHSLLDLLREAVKSILIFNVPLEELPILHLQKEIYLIYDNRFVKEQDVLDAIKNQIRETAKLQKKLLDMSFTFLEKDRPALSDMRDPQQDPWSISWNKHRASDTEESLKKSYGVVATIFCNNYATFVQSIQEIARLLEHLHREGLIPPIDAQQLEQSLLEIVTHQFFLQYNCLDLHKVLPIMAQSHKERFVYCSPFGIDLRKKISKYTSDEAIYDIFLQNKHMHSPPALPEYDNKQELKQLMKEMFLKEFRNNDIISPLLFDDHGKLKLFDSDYRSQQEDDEDEAEREIARIMARKTACEQAKKESKQETKKEKKQQSKKEVKTQQPKKDSKLEQPKKETKIQVKPQEKKDLKKQAKNEPPRPQPKPDLKQKKVNGSPLKSLTSQTTIQDKQNFQIILQKTQSKKEEYSLTPKSEIVQQKQQTKQKEKSKVFNETLIKQQKTKAQTKLAAKQLQKIVGKKKQGQSIDLFKSKDNSKQSLQISTTKIVLPSGTTLQARVTSLTISAQDPDKFNKNINLLKEIHTMRKSMSNTEVLQQLAKDYGQSEIKLEGFEQLPRQEEPQEAKKKRKKNKKKKQKKGEDKEKVQVDEKQEDIINAKNETNEQRTQVYKVNLQRESITQQQRLICNNIQNMEIDDRVRVQCKIDEQVLNNWRKKTLALKKSFSK